MESKTKQSNYQLLTYKTPLAGKEFDKDNFKSAKLFTN